MTLHQFTRLTQDEQATATWQNGTFLAIAAMDHIKILLYQLNSFYVEVFYDTSTAKVCMIKSFTDVEELEPYLHKVDITEVEAILNRV